MCSQGARAQYSSSGVVRSYKLSYSGAPAPAYPVAPTFEFDFSSAPPGNGNTFTVNTGQTLTQRGTITRQTDGTWPAGTSGSQGYEWTFDSSSYINSTISPPAGDFSALCVVMPTASTATATIIGNYDGATNKRGWQLYQSTNTTTFLVSDDGTTGAGHYTSIQVASSIYPGRVSVVAGTYDYVADGSSVMKLYTDNMTAASSTSADGPVYSGAEYLSIGANAGGGAHYAGTISLCAYWDGTVLTQTQYATIRNVLLGVVSTTGVPITTTSATPPALMVAPANSGTEPFLRAYGANLNTISNNGTCSGLYGAGAITNLIRRSLLRTWNGADGGTGCGDYPTGWSAYCAAGDGSVSVSKDATTKAVDVYSARMSLTGTTSAAYIYSNCRTAEIGQNLKTTAWYKCASGSCTSNIILRQFTAAANCTGAYTDVTQSCTGSSWTKCTMSHLAASWAGGTQSYLVLLTETGDGGVTSNWSAPMLRADATAMPLNVDHFCGSDTDADAACNATINSTPSPYSANGPMTTVFTGCTPWDATDLSAVQYVLTESYATAAYFCIIHSLTDEPAWYVKRDSVDKYIAPSVLNWSALTAYTIKYGVDGRGNLRLWWNGSWQTTAGGAGTGIRDAAATTTYVCNSSSAGSNIYVRDLTVYRRLIP